MTRTTRAFASSLVGAGLAIATLAAPVAAQDTTPWLNAASDCEIFRALSTVVPAACAAPGDVVLEPTRGLDLGRTRGIKPRGVRLLDAPVVTPATQQVVAVQQGAPATKSINAKVLFRFDSFDLTDDARAVLDPLAAVLGDELMQGQTIRIEGHADASGPADYNLTLSQLRARSVRAYLIQQHGIAAERLPFVGKGESEPYDQSDPTSPVNRRVVFTNLTG